MSGRLTRVVGTLAEATALPGVALNELVRVGDQQLLGEVLRISGDVVMLQVFEETTGLRVGEPVVREGMPLTIELGPGLLGCVFDGVGRPLTRLADLSGHFIQPGTTSPTIDPSRRFTFVPACAPGDRVEPGDVLGTVEDRGGFQLRVLMPPGRSGLVRTVHGGDITIDDPVITLDEGDPITVRQRWPVRRPRPARPSSNNRSRNTATLTWSSISDVASAATRWRRYSIILQRWSIPAASDRYSIARCSS
jgi:V/A-type H+-transporting ATPase subunit A